MMRKLIETRTGTLSNHEFREVLTLVTQDIQINHIGYGNRTSLAYAVQIATLTFSLLERHKTSCLRAVRKKGTGPVVAKALLEGVM